MKKELRYSIIIFLVWVSSPIILGVLVYLANNVLLTPYFLFYLIFPALIFSAATFFITRIKNPKIRFGAYYSLIGAMIWASPAIYFLQGSDFYASLSIAMRILVILGPSTILSLMFFYIGKVKAEKPKNLSELYLKKNLYSKKL